MPENLKDLQAQRDTMLQAAEAAQLFGKGVARGADRAKEVQKIMEKVEALENKITIFKKKQISLMDKAKELANSFKKDQEELTNKYVKQSNIQKILNVQAAKKSAQHERLTKTTSKLLDKGKIEQDLAKAGLSILEDIQAGNLSVEDLKKRGLVETEGMTNAEKTLVKSVNEAVEAEKLFLEGTDAISEATSAIQAGWKKVAKFMTVTGILTAVYQIATKFAERIDAIGDTFGSIDSLGPELVNSLNAQGAEAIKLGKNQKDVLDSTSQLSSEFGLTLSAATELSGEVLKTAKATGLSNEEAGKLVGIFDQIAGMTGKEASNLVEATSQLAAQRGVAPQQVLKDIAGSTETIAIFTKQGGENLMEAAIAARQMGLSIDTVAKSAKAVLDFESSIAAETEASVLLGQQINLGRARQLALSKDLVGFQKEIKDQLKDIGDFTALDVFQQESLSKALGMSVEETAKLVSGTQKLTLQGSLAAGSFEDLTGQEALSNLSKITNEVKALFEEALILIGPEIENLAEKFKTWIDESGGVSTLKEMFLGLAKGISQIIQYTPHLISLMVGLKVASIATAIATAYLAAAGSAAAAPWTMGTSALVAAASIAAAWGTLKLLSVDDYAGGPGGISYMTGPAGSFALNPRDSVLATTNPISVNDIAAGNIVQGGDGQAIISEIRALRNDNRNQTLEIRLDKLSQGLDPNYGGI